MLRDAMTEVILVIIPWRDEHWRLMLKVLWERRRKRKLQRLSKPLLRWLKKIPAAELLMNANQLVVRHLTA